MSAKKKAVRVVETTKPTDITALTIAGVFRFAARVRAGEPAWLEELRLIARGKDGGPGRDGLRSRLEIDHELIEWARYLSGFGRWVLTGRGTAFLRALDAFRDAP